MNMREKKRKSAHCQDSQQVKQKGKYLQGLPKTFCVFGISKITEQLLTNHNNGIASSNSTLFTPNHFNLNSQFQSLSFKIEIAERKKPQRSNRRVGAERSLFGREMRERKKRRSLIFQGFETLIWDRFRRVYSIKTVPFVNSLLLKL